MKKSKNPQWRAGEYLGCAATAAGTWDVFSSGHYLKRAKERTGEDYMEDVFHFADIFEKAFSYEPFLRFALLHAKTFSEKGKIIPQRFQIRDRGRGLSHIFEIDPKLRETYLLTICTPPEWQKNVFAKRGYIILDVSPVVEKEDIIIISLYDWRTGNSKALVGRVEQKNEIIG